MLLHTLHGLLLRAAERAHDVAAEDDEADATTEEEDDERSSSSPGPRGAAGEPDAARVVLFGFRFARAPPLSRSQSREKGARPGGLTAPTRAINVPVSGPGGRAPRRAPAVHRPPKAAAARRYGQHNHHL